MSEAFCDECGAQARESARFCHGCGRPLVEGVPTIVSPRARASVPGVEETIRLALLPDLVIERPLGRGGMGQVFLAREAGLERPVAVKVLPLAEAGDAASVERFMREARVAAKLRHPHIVPIHAVGQRGSVTYFTMDWVDGRNLGQLVDASGPPPLGETCRIMADVADALAHAHRHGVVHRDIKPPNVMTQSDGHVFVMDFGLARSGAAASLTESGVVNGTPEYLSPEQIEGRPATVASDAYAFGLTLAYLLVGGPLVRGETVAATMAQHVLGEAQSLASTHRAVPDSLRSLVASLVARDPSRRTSDLASAARQLRATATAPVPSADAPPTHQIERGLAQQPPSPARPRTPSTPGRTKTRERLKGLLDKLERPKEGDEG